MDEIKSMLTTEERIRLIFAQPPKVLARIDAILQGQDSVSGTKEADLRLVTFTDAAKRTGLSRPTIYRLARAGRLEIVPLNGTNRVRLQSVVDFINGGSK